VKNISDDDSSCHNHKETEADINVKAAMIHIIGDFIQSIGVLIAALIIYFFENLTIMDPICTVLFSVIVMFTTVPIAKQCIHVLTESAPVDMDLEEMLEEFRKVLTI
jgi:zinc transporter 2